MLRLVFSLTEWSQTKMTQVEIEEKSLLKHLISDSAISPVRRSSGCESGCWHDPRNFLPCCGSPSWSAGTWSIFGCTERPASPCCAVTRECCAQPAVPESSGTQAGAESRAVGRQCRWGVCWGLSIGLCRSFVTSAVISKVSELCRITKIWEDLTSSIPRQKGSWLCFFDILWFSLFLIIQGLDHHKLWIVNSLL